MWLVKGKKKISEPKWYISLSVRCFEEPVCNSLYLFSAAKTTINFPSCRDNIQLWSMNEDNMDQRILATYAGHRAWMKNKLFLIHWDLECFLLPHCNRNCYLIEEIIMIWRKRKKRERNPYDIGIAVRLRMLYSKETIIKDSRKEGYYTLVKMNRIIHTKYLEL